MSSGGLLSLAMIEIRYSLTDKIQHASVHSVRAAKAEERGLTTLSVYEILAFEGP
jgi:hypothetical protein